MMRVESETNLFQRQFLDISALPSAFSDLKPFEDVELRSPNVFY